MPDDYLVMGPDGRQMLKSQYDAENQRAFNTSRLNSLLSAPVAAGAYGVLDQAGVDPAIRDTVTGNLAGFEGIAQGALGARGGMHSENMGVGTPKTVIKRNPGPAAVPPRADYGLNKEDWQEVGHATPYKFNKFDMSKVGSGEGTFMPEWIDEHGHGMYLSNRMDTLRGYVNSIGGGIEGKTGEAPVMQIKRVAIPSNEHLINKDVQSLAAQPEPVLKKLYEHGITAEPTANLEVLLNRLGAGQFASSPSKTRASEILENAGIPGLRYEGYQQKMAGDSEKNNFVMWDATKMRPLRGKIPDRPPLIIEPHRSTPDDGKSIRLPDGQLVTKDNLYRGKAPIGDTWDEPKGPEALSAYKDPKWSKPGNEPPWMVKGKAPDTPADSVWGAKPEHIEKFIDWKHQTYPDLENAPNSEVAWEVWKKAGFPAAEPAKYVPDPGHDDDWNDFIDWKKNNPPPEGEDINDTWDKWVKEGAPPKTGTPIDDLAKQGVIEPKPQKYHTAPAVLGEGAPPESSPWHAPVLMYNKFMNSGYAPMNGLQETEDAWKTWQQAGMPMKGTAAAASPASFLKEAASSQDVSQYYDPVTGKVDWNALNHATNTKPASEATQIWLDTMKATK